LFVTTGTTQLKSRFANEIEDDIHSVLHVDYIKAEGSLVTSYHANNKTDIYLTTLSNAENPVSTSIVLTKESTESFFEMSEANGCNMPVIDIVSVSVGDTVNDTRMLANSDYTVVRPDSLFIRSSKEIVRIYLNNTDSESITIEYTTYPSVSNVQNFFDGTVFGKVYGNILVKHKSPINLSFAIYYAGSTNDLAVINTIKEYFDANIDGAFVVKNMISYLYNQKIVNNIQEPITFSYSRYNESGELETGTFTDQMEATSIEFFRITSITATTL
jgi:hypothetical protein